MRDRYERKHRWTRLDHPESIMAHTPPNETQVSLTHAMYFRADERCDDDTCICHQRTTPNDKA